MYNSANQVYLSSKNFQPKENGQVGPWDYQSEERRVIPWFIPSTICLLIGIAGILFSIFGPEGSYIHWIGFISIVLSCLGAISILILLCMWMEIRNAVDFYKTWIGQAQICWKKEEISGDMWNRFVEEEYGDRGRSRTRLDASWFGYELLKWIVLFGICCGIVAIRVVTKNDTQIKFKIGSFEGSQSFGELLAFLSILITIVLSVPILIDQINFRIFRTAALSGPYDFIVDDNALLWMNKFVPMGPEAKPCAAFGVCLEDKRVNLYNGTRLPCLEICVSRRTKHKNTHTVHYFYYRTPIPPYKMAEAQKYAQRGPGRSYCWKNITAYAAELETPGAAV